MSPCLDAAHKIKPFEVYVTRIWCVFEAFTAAQEGCSYEVILPPLEVDRFCDCVAAGALKHYLWQSLERLDVEAAEASVQADKEHILEMVREGVGFQHLNQAGNRHESSSYEMSVLQQVHAESWSC